MGAQARRAIARSKVFPPEPTPAQRQKLMKMLNLAGSAREKSQEALYEVQAFVGEVDPYDPTGMFDIVFDAISSASKLHDDAQFLGLARGLWRRAVKYTGSRVMTRLEPSGERELASLLRRAVVAERKEIDAQFDIAYFLGLCDDKKLSMKACDLVAYAWDDDPTRTKQPEFVQQLWNLTQASEPNAPLGAVKAATAATAKPSAELDSAVDAFFKSRNLQRQK